MANRTIQFKVAAVSVNTNSFGLRQHIVIAPDGEAWNLHLNHIDQKPVGHVFVVPVTDGGVRMFPGEIPGRRPNAPQSVIDLVWQKGKYAGTVGNLVVRQNAAGTQAGLAALKRPLRATLAAKAAKAI